MPKFKPPYLGAAYYPEVWPDAQVDEDIALMKDAGMTVMRMAEFAWSRMEPSEGGYDFAWLHRAVDKLGEAGIASVLGTPSATPPIWLSEKHPEILFVMENGRTLPHGGRRHYCPNQPVYRRHSARIAEKMAEEFGRDGNVIAWQVDNEVDYPGRPCCCAYCQKTFRDWLERRYGSVEKLNQAWVTGLWSQTYQSFAQIPIPRADVAHHPALLNAWAEFGSDSYVEFVRLQAEALRRHAGQPVGTDMMPNTRVDYGDMHRALDLVQYNHYHGMDKMNEAAFWFDLCRCAKPAPFWNTETATCWNGAATANGYKDPGFCRANSWMPVALGGEATLYWLWRQHRAGQELMHGAVVSSSGRPLHIIDEVREVARGFSASADFLNATRPVNKGLAIHVSCKSATLYGFQAMVNGFDYAYDAMPEHVYRPLVGAQWRPDLIDPSHDLSAYTVLFSPFLAMLDEAGLRERLKAWIEAGGLWIAGPMTDTRDRDFSKFVHAPYGSLEDWAGVRVRHEIPADPKKFKIRWGTRVGSGLFWYDGLEARDAEVLARYQDGPLKGLAAVTRRRMGRGAVVALGTLPDAGLLPDLLAALVKPWNLFPAAKASPNLLCVPRAGAGGEGVVLVEYGNRPAVFQVPREARDLISGKRHTKGRLPVEQYGVRVLKYL